VGAWNHPAPVDPIIFNNTIVNNEARIGAGISNIDAEIVLFNNIIWNEKEQYQDSEILNELTNYCPYWCRDEFNGIIHSDYNSLSDPEVFDACNNCNPSLSDSFCPCEQNYNIGHGTNSFEVNGDVYSVPEFDFYRNVRPNPVDQFVDIGAVESGFLQGHDCVALSSDNHQLPESLTLQILPNPASEFVRITNLKGATTSIKIYNHVGRQVYACEVKESVRIDLSDFAPGMYFITTGDWSICEKMIVM